MRIASPDDIPRLVALTAEFYAERLIETAGLAGLHALFAQTPIESASLVEWVNLLAAQLGVPRDEVTPWKRSEAD